MAHNNFFLVDLNESKTKKLAETITSDTSRKILNYLTEKEDAEQNIAQNLGLPISTVHYHLQKLLEANLVKVEEFHYSQKGREINHYKLANKYIIIAPGKVSGLREKLRGILPVALIVVGIGVVIQLFSSRTLFAAKTAMVETAAESAPKLMAGDLINAAPQTVAEVYRIPWSAYGWGFVVGGIVALGIYLLWGWMNEKWRRD